VCSNERDVPEIVPGRRDKNVVACSGQVEENPRHAKLDWPADMERVGGCLVWPSMGLTALASLLPSGAATLPKLRILGVRPTEGEVTKLRLPPASAPVRRPPWNPSHQSVKTSAALPRREGYDPARGDIKRVRSSPEIG
jgi:hypothetical protein